MTLRQFVELAAVGTRVEREAFETGVLKAAWRAHERGRRGASVGDADVSFTVWRDAFLETRAWLKALGRPLGCRAWRPS